MAVTYDPIATTTLGSNAQTITFSSIPQTYTDLVLVFSSAITAGAADVWIRFNSDSGTNYSSTALFGNGSSAGSARYTNTRFIYLNYYGQPTATLGQSVYITNIMNYSNTTTYKTVLDRASDAASGKGVDAIVGLWRSTSAITDFILDTGSASYPFLTGSTFSLYGVKAA